MKVYYNEKDPYCCEWLNHLMGDGVIPFGHIDSRSISDVQAEEVKEYEQRHWFAGIGGWAYALRLAGWDNLPCDTASCPCQPFSTAGKRKGSADERHLWPEMFRLIRDGRPETIFGEQVASSNVVGSSLEAAFVASIQRGEVERANDIAERIAERHPDEDLAELAPVWIDGVRADLEGEGYSFRFHVLGAHSVQAPHIRQRLYWVAYSLDGRWENRWAKSDASDFQGNSEWRANSNNIPTTSEFRSTGQLALPDGGNASNGGEQRGGEHGQQPPDGGVGGVGDANSPRPQGLRGSIRERSDDCGDEGTVAATGDADWMDVSKSKRGCWRESNRNSEHGRSSETNHWSDFDIIPCSDGKFRRIPRSPEPSVLGMADGLSPEMASVWTEISRGYPLAKQKAPRRAALLRGYGNAIVPQVAAVFIKSFMESIQQNTTQNSNTYSTTH